MSMRSGDGYITKFYNVIESIEKLRNAFGELGQKLPPYLYGMYGELKTASELESGFPNARIEYKSGQSRSDINLVFGNKKIAHVEVKTSTLKDEWYGRGYGFALHVKKCALHPRAYFEHRRRGELAGDLCYFDYLVCVCLSEKLEAKYYIFSREELNKNLESIENKSKHFSHSPYRIIIPVNPILAQLEPFDKRIYRDPEEFLNRWDKIEM